MNDFLRLLPAEAQALPPEPPAQRVEAAAMSLTDDLANLEGKGRLLDVWVAIRPLPAEQERGINANALRWAVRRLIENGLVTVESVVRRSGPMTATELTETQQIMNTAFDEPVFHPSVPPAPTAWPYLRGTPELWERYRKGVLFPPHVETPPSGRRGRGVTRPSANKPLSPQKQLEDHLKRLRDEGTAKTKGEILNYLAQPEAKDLRELVNAIKTAKPKKNKPSKPRTDGDVIHAALEALRRSEKATS